MKNTATVAIIAFIASISFIGGAFYGLNEGVRNYSLLERVAIGALSRHQLAALEKGKPEYVTHALELNIDAAIDRYSLYQTDGNKILSEYFFPGHTGNLERYIDALAKYRSEHPIVFNKEWALPNLDDDPETLRLKEEGYIESQEMLERIKSVLQERGALKPTQTVNPAN